MADIATLGIAIDTGDLVPASKGLDRLSVAAKKAEDAATSMGTRASNAARQLMDASSRASKASEILTRQINQSTRAMDAYSRATRAADISAYGRELDRLRARFNPVFATMQQYRTTLGEIREAHAVGAISSNEMAAAISRERSAALASIAVLKGRSAALNENAMAARRASAVARSGANFNTFNSANIAAQIQDVGITTAMGMSPLQIALQQGTQLSAVLEQMKASGQSAAAGLRTAFLSIVSPMSLVTLGVIGATAAVAQWALTTEDESDRASKALEAHADVIARIKERYGEAAEGLKEYIAESSNVLKADMERAREANEAIVRDISQQLVGDLRGATLSRLGEQTPLLSSFSKALHDLEQALGSGNLSSGLLGFLDAMSRIRTSNYATDAQREFADELTNTAKEAEKAARALPQAAAAAEMMGSQARASTVDVDGFTRALRDLAGIALPALTDAEKAQAALTKALEAAGSDFELRKDALKEFADTMARIRAETEGAKVPIPTPRPNDIERLDEAAKATDKAGDAYDRLINGAQRRLEQMQTELQMVGQTGAAVEAFRFEQDLLSRAKEREIDLTDEQIAKIHELAEAYGLVVQKTAEARMASNLMFELEQIGRGDVEKRVAGQLRQIYGNDYKKHLDGALAGQIRLNEAFQKTQDELEKIDDGMRGTLTDMIDLLYESGDAGEKLVGIFANLGKAHAPMKLKTLLRALKGKSK